MGNRRKSLNPVVTNAPLRAREFVELLVAHGRRRFTTEEAVEALGVSRVATLAALERLAKKTEIVSPIRGFWLIVTPVHRRVGSPPAEDWIMDLMGFWGRPYYVGILSAAAIYGAAHHRPQVFQVVTDAPRPRLKVGRLSFQFVARKNIADIPVREHNTNTGVMVTSTPEATALDLIGYARHAGGLDNVATILIELSEELDGEELVRVAALSPLPWSQRLGFLLDTLELNMSVDTAPLQRYVEKSRPRVAALEPRASMTGAPRDQHWAVAVNTELDPDL